MNLIWRQGRRAVGIEIMASADWRETFNRGLWTLLEAGDIEQGFGVYGGEPELRFGEIRVLPYRMALERAWSEGFPEAGPAPSPA